MDDRALSEQRQQDTELVGLPTHKGAAGVGAVAGGVAAGAAAGMVGGPIGAAIGAAIGAVAGGLGGDAIANSIDQAKEGAYWREQYERQAYVPSGASYDDYGPAYAYGVAAYERFPGRTFDELESDLSRDWPQQRGPSKLEWEHARQASRDAWERVGRR